MTNIEELGFNEPHQYDIEELIAIQDTQLKAQKTAKVVDRFTGEIKRFRTQEEPGEYHEATVNTEPSETDTSDYEPLETTIDKCSRAGVLREYMKKMREFDSKSSLDDDPTNFDFVPDEVERPGYDLSDGIESLNKIVNTLKDTPLSEASKGDATSEPASANASPSEPNATAE